MNGFRTDNGGLGPARIFFNRVTFTGLPGYATRATRLEGLTHSPPLHATHLTGTVSGLCGLSIKWPLSTTNKLADQRNFFHVISAPCMGTSLFFT